MLPQEDESSEFAAKERVLFARIEQLQKEVMRLRSQLHLEDQSRRIRAFQDQVQRNLEQERLQWMSRATLAEEQLRELQQQAVYTQQRVSSRNQTHCHPSTELKSYPSPEVMTAPKHLPGVITGQKEPDYPAHSDSEIVPPRPTELGPVHPMPRRTRAGARIESQAMTAYRAAKQPGRLAV